MITNKRYIVGLLILLMSILIGACSSAPVDTTAIDAANATAATAEAKLAEAEAAAAKAEANAAASAEEIAAAKAEAEAAKVEAEAAMAAAETAKAEAAAAVPAAEVEMTDVGTPRNETLIFQTFDRQTADPGNMNPMLAYARWRGFRELGWGWLWETDTGTGESYGELAAGPA